MINETCINNSALIKYCFGSQTAVKNFGSIVSIFLFVAICRTMVVYICYDSTRKSATNVTKSEKYVCLKRIFNFRACRSKYYSFGLEFEEDKMVHFVFIN